MRIRDIGVTGPMEGVPLTIWEARWRTQRGRFTPPTRDYSVDWIQTRRHPRDDNDDYDYEQKNIYIKRFSKQDVWVH
jgi:hypothetical protein